jgi:tetratricopeptide (TPR) repeat protein
MKFLIKLLFLYLIISLSACSTKSLGQQCNDLVSSEDYQKALPICERAYNQALWKLGETHPETLISQMGLVETYLFFKRYDDAEFLANSLKTRMSNSSPNMDKAAANLSKAVILRNLAFIHEKQGKLKQSIEDWKNLYDWTKQVSESEFIVEQFSSAVAVTELCLQENRVDEAKYYFKIAQDIHTRYADTKKLSDDDIEIYQELVNSMKQYL